MDGLRLGILGIPTWFSVLPIYLCFALHTICLFIVSSIYLGLVKSVWSVCLSLLWLAAAWLRAYQKSGPHSSRIMPHRCGAKQSSAPN
jgi:hypothetical protein